MKWFPLVLVLCGACSPVVVEIHVDTHGESCTAGSSDIVGQLSLSLEDFMEPVRGELERLMPPRERAATLARITTRAEECCARAGGDFIGWGPNSNSSRAPLCHLD